jgi:hypothetical protein
LPFAWVKPAAFLKRRNRRITVNQDAFSVVDDSVALSETLVAASIVAAPILARSARFHSPYSPRSKASMIGSIASAAQSSIIWHCSSSRIPYHPQVFFSHQRDVLRVLVIVALVRRIVSDAQEPFSRVNWGDRMVYLPLQPARFKCHRYLRGT